MYKIFIMTLLLIISSGCVTTQSLSNTKSNTSYKQELSDINDIIYSLSRITRDINFLKSELSYLKIL